MFPLLIQSPHTHTHFPLPLAYCGRSLAAYFVGNASGMDSEAELQGEIKLGYVGIGWQLNNIPSHYSHLEK